MSLIEGIGDEVAVFSVILLVLILVATFIFVLNSSPISERFTSHTTANVSSQHSETPQCDEQPETDECNSRSGNTETIASISNPSSSDNEQNSLENTNGVLDTNCLEDTSPRNIKNSQIYPDISEETITGNINEESEIMSEDSPSNSDWIHIRLKYLNDTERSVTSCLTMTIGEFKRTHFMEDLADNKVVRLIYAGQRLQDHATLQTYGITDHCVIHVQVVEAQVPNTSSNQNTDLDLSHLLWPLLSVILGICWILYFKYPEFFNFMSVGILFLFTGSFIFFYSQVQIQ